MEDENKIQNKYTFQSFFIFHTFISPDASEIIVHTSENKKFQVKNMYIIAKV